MTIDKTAIRDAATVIVLRDGATDPHVLMGQRGAQAAFMPNKFVFPGGAVDAADAQVRLARGLPALCAERLEEDSRRAPDQLAVAAIRELWEETGLILGEPGSWDGQVPEDWVEFAEAGYLPVAHALQFVFRAITPPGRPRRFDARFFLIDAGEISSDLDDFSRAQEELSHLQWVPLAKARHDYDLPFITEVVLAEVEARAHDPAPPASVPFFRNDDEASLFIRLRGYAPRSDE
ncbi:NUDIX hydrolase [Roseovarius faecimaris]|uniref:NUDIX hydrolase n=1 Tax=Roseovarius faecimaris TaxID=2494550 RepID=A0A6I6IPE3_9RHOB|nr:NUDIX hydrolase [Roseovarius faecimaris]QGX98929.1 NUDIX hydrolase [Roseovarius faecimaris]